MTQEGSWSPGGSRVQGCANAETEGCSSSLRGVRSWAVRARREFVAEHASVASESREKLKGRRKCVQVDSKGSGWLGFIYIHFDRDGGYSDFSLHFSPSSLQSLLLDFTIISRHSSPSQSCIPSSFIIGVSAMFDSTSHNLEAVISDMLG